VPALIKYHELTQSSVAQGMFLSLMDYFVEQRRAMPEILNGFAYAYLLTHNQKYIAAAELGLGALMRNQIKNRDPMVNGLIYEKVIYHRPNIFLANVPYVFGALNESLLASRQTIHHDE